MSYVRCPHCWSRIYKSSLKSKKIELDEKRKYAIEVGNQEEKAKQLSALLEEAHYEYEDRKNRLDQLTVEVDLLSKQMSSIVLEQTECNQKLDEAGMLIRRLQNRREVLANIV